MSLSVHSVNVRSKNGSKSDINVSDSARRSSERKQKEKADSFRKKIRPNKLNLKKRNDLKVIFHGENVTPKLLEPLDDGCFEFISFSQMDLASNIELNVFKNISTSQLQSNIHSQSLMGVSSSRLSKSSSAWRSSGMYTDDEDVNELSSMSENSWEEEEFILPKEPAPTRIKLFLNETPIEYLLDINSKTEIKGSDTAKLIEKDNDKYDYLTIGKGRNRKTINAEIQTNQCMFKSRSTWAKRPSKQDNFAFASQWDMFDTYESQGEQEIKAPDKHSSFSKWDGDEQMELKKLLKNPDFQLAVLVMERALANNVFSREQKIFRGLISQDPFRPNVEYNYGLKLLWTFKTKETAGHPIVCMQWHPTNSDILACGYGKFLYNHHNHGLIYCWNIKNPSQPEREFRFRNSVTSMSFSKAEPNILAVGLYDGTVALLDISRRDVQLIQKTKLSETVSYEPIWDMAWFEPDVYNINHHHIVSVCEDGTVSAYVATKTNDLLRIEMLKMYLAESDIKGVYQPRNCIAHEIPLIKSASALKLQRHPMEQNVFFVGTGQGSVHKCSENNQKSHNDVFIAHNGPIYGIQFSHFCAKIYLTCGADACIRLWFEEINEPLTTLTTSFHPIDGAEWCPSYSTIIANICNTSILLWDLQRRTYKPAAEHTNPNNSRNTVIKFNPSGKNLAVGDIDGELHIFSLVDLPFPPFYQGEMLEQVMYKNMVIRPDIVQKIKEAGFSYNRRKSYHVF